VFRLRYAAGSQGCARDAGTVVLVTPGPGGPAPDGTGVRGLVLAAGAGTRYGGPKALARDEGGVPWVERVVVALRDGGCDDVLVVLGAGADRARALVPGDAVVVEARDWALGLASSLAAALDVVLDGVRAGAAADALVIVPVDVPGLPASAVARVIAAAGTASSADAADPRRAAALVRATHGGLPGHPVLLGADHWEPLRARLPGGAADAGAGPHLAALAAAAGTAVTAVACDDLWDGLDVDAPPIT